jgi:tetratricopeptide (TPR) repeat protein
MEAAHGYLMLDLPDQALKELADVAEFGEHVYQYHLLKGEALRNKQDYKRGLAAFQKAHELNPEDLASLMGLAWCYKRVDRLDQSIEMMKLAYETHKDVPVVLYNLACYYSLAGEKDQALSWLGRALRMDREFIKLVPKEADFDPIRDDPDFVYLIELTTS